VAGRAGTHQTRQRFPVMPRATLHNNEMMLDHSLTAAVFASMAVAFGFSLVAFLFV
jgi:hypothetical protein